MRSQREWISVRESMRRTGLGEQRIQTLIAKGQLEVLRLPASPLLVSAVDLERVMRESRRPAQRVTATASVS